MSERRWRIQIDLVFPRLLVAVEPPDPGETAPKQLGTASRVPTEARDLGGIRLAIRPKDTSAPDAAQAPSNQFDIAELLLEVDAESPFAALERTAVLVELILDCLAFDLQAAIAIGQTNIRDVTPPLAVGEERDFLIFASYPGDKFARAEDIGSIHTAQTPSLLASYGLDAPRARAALRWYVKSLGTPFLHDRFMFLWVAAEIFADDSGISIDEPLPLKCGHTLTNCPICSATTKRKVRGASIRAYLEARGMDSAMAKTSWRLRQMFHGAVHFDSEKLADLPPIVQTLRAISAAELKAALGLQPNEPPLVVAGVASGHPGIAVQGHAPIAQSDLTWPQ